MSIVALGSAENRVSLYYEEMATKGNGLNVRQDVLRVRTMTLTLFRAISCAVCVFELAELANVANECGVTLYPVYRGVQSRKKHIESTSSYIQSTPRVEG